MNIRIKTPEQIELIRKASILAAETVQYLSQFALPGNTTKLIDKKCEEYVRDHHAKAASKGYKGFPGFCCTSPNDVICHGVPNDYILKDGDILNIDVAVILNGFFGDTCRMYEIGEVKEEGKKIISVAKECLKLGISQCTAGNRLGNVGFEISRYAKHMGCSVVYEFCGHGVGILYHEDPEVNHANKEKNIGPILKPGMIFTVEPMINLGKGRSRIDKKDNWTARTIDGKWSAQFEHTICITETVPDVMTDIYNEFAKPEKVLVQSDVSV